jgi:hypothetical protein
MKSQMEIDIDINRPDLHAEVAVEVRTQPVTLTVSMPTVKRLQQFFTNEVLQEMLGEVVGESLDVIKQKVCY